MSITPPPLPAERATAAPSPGQFFVTGGTIPPDSPCYVERRADRELYEALRRGEFCYVLTPRQMGKSSLMVRTARRLRDEGIAVAVLDLTAVGQNLTPEQWYEGLLGIAGRQLGLEEELEAYWVRHQQASPVRRWVDALRDVVLAEGTPGLTAAQPGGSARPRVVLFLDEIDFVRSLPFPTDELFAAIRACHNARASDPVFGRLTFCLLGVATPSDLIQDSRSTPFNIGRRIDLDDFTPAEALPLAGGMRGGPAGRLLARALYWTGGHPYLTQRLCRAAVEDEQYGVGDTAAGVDRCTRQLFLLPQARQRDDNLLFVRDRLLRAGADVTGLLELYRRVRSRLASRVFGHRVHEADMRPLVGTLRLSGVVRAQKGHLEVRNRIYERVFDQAWIRESLPNAERQRQRAAYWRGVVLATVVSSAVTAAMAGLAMSLQASLAAQRLTSQRLTAARDAARHAEQTALSMQHNAEQARSRTEIARKLALTKSEEADRARHQAERERGAADRQRAASVEHLTRLRIAESVRLLSAGDGFGALTGSVQALQADQGQPERERIDRIRLAVLLRHGPRLIDQRRLGHFPPGASLHTARFSPDGRYMAALVGDAEVQIWDSATGRVHCPPLRHPDRPISDFRFSPDGTRMVTASAGGTAQVWRVRSGAAVGHLHKDGGEVRCVVWSPDSKLLATGLASGAISIWNADEGTQVSMPAPQPVELINALAFSPDGRTLASACSDSTARIWSVARGVPMTPAMRQENCVQDVQFSPDGRLLATACDDGSAQLWNTTTGDRAGKPLRHNYSVERVRFSPDGKYLVTAKIGDGTARLWSVSTGAPIGAPLQHGMLVEDAEFTRDSRSVITWSSDGQARMWDSETGAPETPFLHNSGRVLCISADPGPQRVTLLGADGILRSWDCSKPTAGADPFVDSGDLSWCVRSDDGARSITIDESGHAYLWRVSDHRRTRRLLAHPGRASFAFISGNGKRAITTGGGKLVLWDTDHATRCGTPLPCADEPVAALSQDGTRVLIANGLTACVRDAVTGNELARVAHRLRTTTVGALSQDGNLAFSGSANGPGEGEGKLWDIRGHGRRVRTLAVGGRVMHATFSSDGHRLAVANDRGSGAVWDAASGRRVTPPLRHAGAVAGIAFNPKGDAVATASYDFTARIWSSETGSPLTPPLRHSGPLTGVAFSPDGLLLITMGAHFARIWDVRTGEPVSAELRGAATFFAAWITPDGRHLLTNTARDVGAVWDVAPERRPLNELGALAERLSGASNPLTVRPLNLPRHHIEQVR